MLLKWVGGRGSDLPSQDCYRPVNALPAMLAAQEAFPVWLYQRPWAGRWTHRAAPVWAQRLLVTLPIGGATGLVSSSSVGRRMQFEKEAYGVCPDPRSSRQDERYSWSHLGMQKPQAGDRGCSLPLLCL